MTIPTRPLGRTGEDVTILGYGAMELRGEPRGPLLSEEEFGSLLNTVLDSGINLIDTSIDYGHSEELIGQHLRHRRSEFVLTSKCGCSLRPEPGVGAGRAPHDYGVENVRAGTEQSLRRLKTDHLDVLQIHMSPTRTQIEQDGTVEEMVKLRDEGKIRFLGMSGILPNLPDHIEMGVFDVFQIPYSAVQREHEDLITKAAESGAGTLIRGGAARGAAAEDKKWNRGPIGLPEGEGARRWSESGADEILGEMNPMEFVLRFTLSHPSLSSTIVGTSNLDHLRSNVAIAERGPLPDDVYNEAKRRLNVSSQG